MWTGNSFDSIQLLIFITNADKHNSITFYPGSHFLGLLPVKNRKLDENNFKLKNKPFSLNNILAGDIIIFHPLLLHSSVIDKKNKSLRVSIGTRVKSFEKNFSSQEKSTGYKVINIGPINHIKRVIGNDYLQPLRIYEGKQNVSLTIQDDYPLLKENNKNDELIKKYLKASKKIL